MGNIRYKNATFHIWDGHKWAKCEFIKLGSAYIVSETDREDWKLKYDKTFRQEDFKHMRQFGKGQTYQISLVDLPHCMDCGQAIFPDMDSDLANYELASDPNRPSHKYMKVCFECVAERDKRHMEESGEITLYLTTGKVGLGKMTYVQNWSGSLRFPSVSSKGKHSIAGSQYSVWFIDHNGRFWYGRVYGENQTSFIARPMKTEPRWTIRDSLKVMAGF